MPSTPTALTVVDTSDPTRPVGVLVDHGPDRLDLTLVQAWELLGDLQATVHRHPVPTLPPAR